MKRTLLTLIAVLLLGGAAIAQNHWDAPDSHAKSSNTPIVASVTVDDAAPATGAELAVFVGEGENEELRGLATTTLDGKYWVQAFYNSGSTETLTFKLWNPADGGAELDTYTLTYGDLTALTTCEEGYGTPGNPVQIAFTATQMQEMQFAQGWSWWSTYIELSNVNGLALLETALGEDGLFIKAGNGQYVEYLPDWEMWWGDDDMVICNENSYEIGVSANRSTTLPGRIANPSDHPITISQGWNWIGYPVTTQLAVDNAFSSINPTEDDIILDRNGFSTYYPGYGFWGDIEYMTPGVGYKYRAYGSGSQTLTYPSGSRTNQNQTIVMKESRAESFEHRYLMNVIAIAEIDGRELTNESYEIQAMSNGHDRGRAVLRYCEPTGKYIAMLTIYGDSNEKLHFVLNDTDNGQSYMVNESLSFNSEEVLGTLSSPFAFHATSSESLCLENIFPNPAKPGSEVYLELNKVKDEEGLLQIEVFNGLGERVYNTSCSSMPVSFKAPTTSGFYVVRLTVKNGKVYHGNLIVTQ